MEDHYKQYMQSLYYLDYFVTMQFHIQQAVISYYLFLEFLGINNNVDTKFSREQLLNSSICHKDVCSGVL